MADIQEDNRSHIRDVRLFLEQVVDGYMLGRIVSLPVRLIFLLGGILSFKSTGSLNRHTLYIVLGVMFILFYLVFRNG